jgi:hypothetical protein
MLVARPMPLPAPVMRMTFPDSVGGDMEMVDVKVSGWRSLVRELDKFSSRAVFQLLAG